MKSAQQQAMRRTDEERAWWVFGDPLPEGCDRKRLCIGLCWKEEKLAHTPLLNILLFGKTCSSPALRVR
jgi:hypothetical protein